MFSVDN